LILSFGAGLHGAESADLRGSIYIDPWTVRKEIVVHSQFLESKIDGSLEEARETIAAEIHTLLAEKAPLSIDGREVPFEPGRVRFLQVQEGAGLIELEEGAEFVASQLLVATDAQAPLPNLDSQVSGRWLWYPEGVESVELSLAWPQGGDSTRVSPEAPGFEVEFDLPEDSRAAPEPPPAPESRNLSTLWYPLLLSLAATAFLLRARKRGRSRARFAAAGCTIAASVAWIIVLPGLRIPPRQLGNVSHDEAELICERLLEGVYHGFNFHQAEVQYEVLAVVLAGAALEETFLEAQRTRERQARDDTRVTVIEVTLLEAEPEPLTAARGFAAHCRWRTIAQVGHWGHFHERHNHYAAELRVEVVDGAWRATGFELGMRERE